MNFMKVFSIALQGLQLAAPVAQEFGSEDHVTAAKDAIGQAGNVALSVITDPQEQAEAVAATVAAQGAVSLVAMLVKAFKKQPAPASQLVTAPLPAAVPPAAPGPAASASDLPNTAASGTFLLNGPGLHTVTAQ